MSLNRRSGRVLAGLPGAGFFAAACFGGLAIVFGSYAIWSDYREHEGLEGRFVGILMLGIILIVLAFLSEKAGPTRRIAIIFRNLLVGLCPVSVFLATLVVLIGPLHRGPTVV